MAETVLLVNGVPGSGKSTLSVPLARRLGLPLLSRDAVKESLFDSLGARDRAWSRELGVASARMIWSLMPYLPGTVMVDNNVGPRIREVFRTEAEAAGVRRVVEIWCELPPVLAMQRYRARAATTRHPGHRDLENRQTLDGLRDLNVPLQIGPLLRVPTDRAVDLDAVAAWVEGELARGLVG